MLNHLDKQHSPGEPGDAGALRRLAKKLSNRSKALARLCKGTVMWALAHRFKRAEGHYPQETTEDAREPQKGGGAAGVEEPDSSDIPVPLLNPGEPEAIYFSPKSLLMVGRNQVVFSNRLYPALRKIEEGELVKLAGSADYPVLTFLKTYGLGDIILSLPLLRAFKRMFPEKTVRLASREKFASLLQNDPQIGFLQAPSLNAVNPEGHGELKFNLDINTVEYDHVQTHPFRYLHRTDILFHLFSVPQEHRIYDYSISLTGAERQRGLEVLARTGFQPGEYVVVASRGSGPNKTLAPAVREGLLRKLSEKVKVLVMDEAPAEDAFEHPNIRWLDGLQLMELVAVVNFARAICAMDSGLLWISHALQKPTVCFLGPTLERTRLTRHSLYPERVKAINLLANVGCPTACFDMPKLGWCKGRITCMKDLDVARLASETLDALDAVCLEVERK